MFKLSVVQAKPNPRGKDRLRGLPTEQMLREEWIDIQNTGNEIFHINSVVLYHLVYTQNRTSSENRQMFNFSNYSTLAVGGIVRIHTGSWCLPHQLAYEDREGVNDHLFVGSANYLWNNDGDMATLVQNVGNHSIVIDQASYTGRVREGILVRVNNMLV